MSIDADELADEIASRIGGNVHNLETRTLLELEKYDPTSFDLEEVVLKVHLRVLRMICERERRTLRYGSII